MQEPRQTNASVTLSVERGKVSAMQIDTWHV